MSERSGGTVGDVLERAAQGEAAALGELFVCHAGLVFRVALRLTGSADDADDVVQDVFVGLPEALRLYDGASEIETWLRQLTVRRSLMVLRTARRRQVRERLARSPAPGARHTRHSEARALTAHGRTGAG